MRPAWSIHSREGRRYRVAELVTAHDDSRSYELMAPGIASVSVARNDLQVDIDRLRLDNLLVCEADDSPPWVGAISQLREGLDGMIAITAEGLPVLLDGVTMPVGETYSQVGSGAVVQAVLRNSNRQQHTGLFVGKIGAGPAVTDFALGGQTGLSALDDVAERTDWEWSVRYRVSPGGLDGSLDWQSQQGDDVSDRVHLYERRDFVELTYGLDLASLKAAVTAIGGTGAIAERASATAAANETLLRRLRAYRTGSYSRVILDPSTAQGADLRRLASSDQSRSVTAAENYVVAVGPSVDWADLAVGNRIRLNFRFTLSGDATRVARILGTQPNRDEGVNVLTLEGVL